MPMGKTHNAINLAALGPLAWIASTQLNLQPLPLLCGSGAYLFATFFMSPDLDLSHSSPSRRWKYLAPLWWPYRIFFRHRGLSHNPLLGSLTRLLYLGLCAFIVILFIYLATHDIGNENMFRAIASASQPVNQKFWQCVVQIQHHALIIEVVLAGIWVSDLVHIFSDYSFSGLKKFFR